MEPSDFSGGVGPFGSSGGVGPLDFSGCMGRAIGFIRWSLATESYIRDRISCACRLYMHVYMCSIKLPPVLVAK